MPYELNMPQLSDTMTEGTLVKWNKKEGDAIKAGEEVADVETDKATMPMECAEAGTLAVVLTNEGQKVPVGGTIGVIALKGEKVEEVKAKYAAGTKSSAKPAATAVAVSTVASTATTPSPKKEDGAEIAVGDHPNPGEAPVSDASPLSESNSSSGHQPAPAKSSNGTSERLRISPLARRIAADKGIDPSTLQGSGPGGRIVQQDVLNPQTKAAPAAASAPAKSAAPKVELPARVAAGTTEKVELNKMRQVIAQRLQQSKQSIPHFYESLDIDMNAAVELRKKLLAAYEKSEGVRISIGDIIAKAVACTLKSVPQMNATFDEKTNTITRYGDVNLGMAVALPDGLIVPVLRNIDQMGIKEIRQRSADIVDRARAQRLKREEMSGATFTVSNLGVMGIKEFNAIVNPPEVGILAIGASEDRAVVKNGQIVIRTMMTVTLSCDHRVIDGSVAASFLTTLKGFLEEPAMMLS
jgi:pyruvate dehydrogenase E2 component (dihydrolipoamide acetyltransferase)